MTVNTESEVYDAIAEKNISQHRQLELFVDVNSKRSCVNQHEEPAATAQATTSRRHAQPRHWVIPIHYLFHGCIRQALEGGGKLHKHQQPTRSNSILSH